MRHLVAIHRDSGTRNNFGVKPESFALLASVNADYRSLGGDESQQAGRTEAKGRAEFEMAYYSGLTTKDQLVFDSRTFRITHIDNVGGMNVKHVVEAAEVD